MGCNTGKFCPICSKITHGGYCAKCLPIFPTPRPVDPLPPEPAPDIPLTSQSAELLRLRLT